MIMRGFMLALAVGSMYAGTRNLLTYRALLQPVSAFVKVEGQVQGTDLRIEQLPGDGPAASTTLRLYAVSFNYTVGGVERKGARVSPSCESCERDVVRRATGREPEALAAGTPVAVYVLQSDPAQGFLELPQRSDFWRALRMALLWLVGIPAFAFFFAKSWPTGPTHNDENDDA